MTRETRLLLITALVSLVVLWGLARMRFPDRPATPNPLSPVLTQLAPRSPLEEIPTQVAELMPRVAAWVTPADVPVLPLRASDGPRTPAAFRIRDDVAVMLIDDGLAGDASGSVVVHDHVSGLAVVRVPTADPSDLPAWVPRRLDGPRFVIEAEASAVGVALRPVFVSGMSPAPSALWGGTIWLLPAAAGLRSGSAALTPDGAVIGLVVGRDGGGAAIVPWPAVEARVEGLLRDPPAPPGRLGFDIQPLTPSVAAAAGAHGGVIVTRVESDGPAAAILQTADVIEAIQHEPVTSLEDWRARAAGMAAGGVLALVIRRGGRLHEVSVVAAARDEEEPPAQFGVAMRTLAGTGAEVVRVWPASAGARAGLRAGDVITFFDGRHAPTAAQISRDFAAYAGDAPLLLVIARGDTSQALTVSRQP